MYISIKYVSVTFCCETQTIVDLPIEFLHGLSSLLHPVRPEHRRAKTDLDLSHCIGVLSHDHTHFGFLDKGGKGGTVAVELKVIYCVDVI
jgi:hypothetical protein